LEEVGFGLRDASLGFSDITPVNRRMGIGKDKLAMLAGLGFNCMCVCIAVCRYGWLFDVLFIERTFILQARSGLLFLVAGG